MICSIFLGTFLSPLTHRVTCKPLTPSNTTADVIANAASDVKGNFDDAATEIRVSSVSVSAGPADLDTAVCSRLLLTNQVPLSSTCPWHYQEDLQLNRWPQRVVKAVLTCGGNCLVMRGPDHKGAPSGGMERQSCQPVHHLVSVTYLNPSSSPSSGLSRNETEPVWLPVPIAYTCAFDQV